MSDTPIDPFTERMARAQDAMLDDRAIREQVRARLLAGQPVRRDRSDRGVVLLSGFAGLGGLAAAAAMAAFVLSGPSEMAVHQGGEPLAVGAWIDASDGAAELDFSDGTRVSVAAGSTARLASMTERGASIQLERGALDLDVVHTGEAEWEILAGPFSVDVTGTAFETSWSPDDQVFRIHMREGSVVVEGPFLDGPRQVGGTDVLEVDMVARRGQLTMAEPEAPEPTVEPEPSLPQAAPHTPAVDVDPEGEGEGEADGWHQAYLADEYDRAIQLAEEEGIEGILAIQPAEELAHLADAAKLAGRSELEAKTLEAVRTRFAGTRAAANAAYHLGRLAQDVDGDPTAAADFYRTAHDEGCANPALALGQHLQLLQRLGDTKAARKAAIEYLEKYPDGVHATLAEGLAPRRR